VHVPAPHEALGDFPLPCGFGDGATAPRTGAALFFRASSFAGAGSFAGVDALGATAAFGASCGAARAGVTGAVGSGPCVAPVGGDPGAPGTAGAGTTSGAAVARSALLHPSVGAAVPSTASAVKNVSSVSDGLRIARC